MLKILRGKNRSEWYIDSDFILKIKYAWSANRTGADPHSNIRYLLGGRIPGNFTLVFNILGISEQ